MNCGWYAWIRAVCVVGTVTNRLKKKAIRYKMAARRHFILRSARPRNVQFLSDAVIDLTADSPVSSVPITEQTNQSVISLDDTMDLCSPVKQARVEDCDEKKSPKKKSCKKKLSESFFCPVCLEGLKFHNPAPEQQVMSTQCGHMFCHSCIVATISKTQECPLCRTKQTIENIHPLYV